MHLHVCLCHGTAVNGVNAATAVDGQVEGHGAPGIDRDTKTTAHNRQAKECDMLRPSWAW